MKLAPEAYLAHEIVGNGDVIAVGTRPLLRNSRGGLRLGH